ncbi:hypothetical protein [Nannocystis pusilla]|uniref:hypothetical protein n=1 Tax=Nannocystis pusilla TaxID=889268 RepID=UPI003DA3E25A
MLDRFLVQLSAFLVAVVWLISDWTGRTLSEGTKASLAAFVGYALLKQRGDNRWRALEEEREELRQLLFQLERTAPGSPEALRVRRELVELARRSEDDE